MLKFIASCQFNFVLCLKTEPGRRYNWLHPCSSPAGVWPSFNEKPQHSGTIHLVLLSLHDFDISSKILTFFLEVGTDIFNHLAACLLVIWTCKIDEAKLSSGIRGQFRWQQGFYEVQTHHSALAHQREVPRRNYSSEKNQTRRFVESKLCKILRKKEA